MPSTRHTTKAGSTEGPYWQCGQRISIVGISGDGGLGSHDTNLRGPIRHGAAGRSQDHLAAEFATSRYKYL